MEYHKNFSLEPLFYINEEGLVCQEEFRDIIGYEGLYQASNLGRIKSFRTKNPLIMKPYFVKNNYLSIAFSVKSNLKLYSVHQLVAMAFLNHIPCGYKKIVDHIVEGNRLDNRLCNLQITTARNNTSKSIKKSVSKYTGVSWDKTVNKWRAAIHQNKKSVYLGAYETEEQASEAYQNALSRILSGEIISKYINPKKTSKYKGVNWDKDRSKWLVRIKSKNIGRFDSEEEAHLAYQKALERINQGLLPK